MESLLDLWVSSSRPLDRASASSSWASISPPLRGEVTVLLLSSTDADELGVCGAAGAGVEVEIEAVPEDGLLSLFMLPLLSIKAGLSLSFFLLSVLTMGWS